MGNVNYWEYIKSEQWIKFRDKIYTEKKGRCELCNKKVYGSFNVHHVNYANLGHEKKNDVMLFCFNCHKYFHKFKS